MASGEPVSSGLAGSTLESRVAPRATHGTGGSGGPDSIIVTEVSPFHCLYQDALEFHSQSRLMLSKSEGASSRLARASLLLYVASAEALIHQAAVELGRADLASLIADPSRPLPALEVWKLLPAVVGAGSPSSIDFSVTPWPQMAELLELRAAWAYPGPSRDRLAFYRSSRTGASFEPLLPHQAPKGARISAEMLVYPRTGLPKDPYALRPLHLDTIRGVLDSSIEALDRKLEGALTRDNRHRREPIRSFNPAD